MRADIKLGYLDCDPPAAQRPSIGVLILLATLLSSVGVSIGVMLGALLALRPGM